MLTEATLWGYTRYVRHRVPAFYFLFEDLCMKWLRTFFLLFVVFSNIFLTAQDQAQKKDQAQTKDAAAGWVFAYAQTETQLVPVGRGLDEAAANSLTWAICEEIVTRVSLVATGRTSDAYQYQAAESLPIGTYCLLVDSASHDGMFFWGWSEPSGARFACVKGFSEAGEELAGRKVDSCYFIGGHGAGAVEIIQYKNQSPTDRLAALVVDDFRDTLDHRYWMAKFPASDKGWLSPDNGNFHPEKFHYLFTIIDDTTDTNGDGSPMRFVGIERETSDGVDLTLYKPVGNQLKPVVANHHALQNLVTQN